MTQDDNLEEVDASVQRRRALVEQLMESLEGVEELEPSEQLERLGEAQELLTAVLNDTPDQQRIPGLGRAQ